MRRREFITGLGGAAAWPMVARALETGRTYRLGLLLPMPRQDPWVVAFFDELRVAGFVEDQNLVVVPSGFGVSNDDHLAERAIAIVKQAPDVIISGPTLSTRAFQAATKTIPLFGITEDMVSEGLASSLARPGGNTTGISILSPELDGKRQDILMEAVPGVRRMA
jgi:putative tryptophan/tyrosine transport system substrate-binding protein